MKEKSSCSNELGSIKVVDVYASRFGKDDFSNEEISRALYCCSSKEKLCSLCPYVREDDCETKVQIDGARWISTICFGGRNDKQEESK